MNTTKHIQLIVSLAAAALFAAGMAGRCRKPRFEPTWESLENYRCPKWFRDAKLGIFICWNPYTVPAVDDWYARHMYMQGHRQYQYHLDHYGHPSKFGYKDIIALWKGEKFDADRMVRLFKQAGAKYIVPMAVHHDNFDLWDSRYHRWNSVNMGPKKDIVGLWREASLKHGLRFGVTTHLARSYNWLNTSKGCDSEGPYAGVPYDGADPDYADLYHEPHGDTSKRYPRNPSESWKREWFTRIKDLVDQHHPDLLYFDGGVPFGKIGLEMIAYYFNDNMRRHNGRLEAVFNIKNMPDGQHGEYRDGMCVLDLERGMLGSIRPLPWQNDTSIGPWFWTRDAKYKSPDAIIDAFVDIISKNGNLLLNVPPKADGMLDDEAEKILAELGAWTAVNGEAVYSSRPWRIYGEGPTAFEGGYFKETTKPFTASDIRFTTKGEVLYAFFLDWPLDGVVTVRSLSQGRVPLEISKITLLGHDGDVQWSRDRGGLMVRLPSQRPCDYAYALKIE